VKEQKRPERKIFGGLHRPIRPLREMRAQRMRRALVSILLGAAIAYILLFVSLPFFIYRPGTAEPVRPMVHVNREAVPEEGSFLLTTVRVNDPNIVNYLYSLIDRYDQIVWKRDIFRNGESEKEYSLRQDYVMLDSQSNAIQAAYNKAGIPYRISNEGVIVLQVLKDMPAASSLRAGDYIVRLDDAPVSVRDDVLNYLAGKRAGDAVRVTYRRNGAEKTVTLSLAPLPPDSGQQAGEGRPGLGIVVADVRSVKAEREEDRVKIDAGEIGGPSAGLMFSLEVYSRLINQDLTKGYRVAGTGTISPDGKVGVIGGIRHKVVAADRKKADIFFTPKDLRPSAGESFTPVLNATEAMEQAKAIGSAMKIVPVATLDEAVAYLQSLPPKNS
jgi:PDZ domain-containing protein